MRISPIFACLFLILPAPILTQDDERIIVIVGGDNGETMDLVETIRPDPPGPPIDQHCSPLPVVSQYMVAFQDGQGRPVACGGIGNLDPQQCYTYQGGSWSATARMLQDRQQGAGVAQLADGRAFVFGGHDGKPVDTKRSTELFYPDLGRFLYGPALPFDSDFSCGLEIPGRPGIVFIAGSGAAEKEVIFFDVDTGEVMEDETLPNPRYHVACGIAESPLGGHDIVIAGGLLAEDTVDVLHLDSMTWRPGTPLPIGLQGPAAMQVNEDLSSFIIIGGGITDSPGYSSNVYEYVGLDEEWVLRPDLEMQFGREALAATFAKVDPGCYD